MEEEDPASLRRRFRDDIHGVLSRAHTRRGGAPAKLRSNPAQATPSSQEKTPELARTAATPAPAPEPTPKAAPRVRKMVLEEATEEADTMRQEVQDVRRKLARLDAETTKLTAQLKGSRASFVSQVRKQSQVEDQVANVLKANASKLPAQAIREEEDLNREVAKLSQELHEAKKEGAKWAGVAKRQEEMLQEESDAAKGAESLLAKHPCGEVFLTPYPDDGSDDGGYYGDAGPRRHGRKDDIALGSSDDDDYDARRGRQHDRSVPQPPGQKWRSPLGHDDDDESDGSSMPSPSGSSGPLSASASPSGEVENGRMAASLAKRAAANGSGSGSRVGIGGGQRAYSASESEEEDSSGSAGASGSSDARQSPSGKSGSPSGGKFKKAVHKVTTQALKESRELSQQSGVGNSVSEEISSEEKLSSSSAPLGASGRTVSSEGDEV